MGAPRAERKGRGEEGKGPRSWVLRTRSDTLPSYALLHDLWRKGVRRPGGGEFFLFFSLYNFLGALSLSWDRPGQRAKG